MPILLVGVNHTTAPVAVRERFALSAEDAERMLDGLGRYIPHSVVLATCNRTEIYTTVHNTEVAVSHLQRFLADWSELGADEIARYLYTRRQWESVNHLFRVASGLDSMILGEEQILGQVRGALETATLRGAADTVLTGAFRQAIRTGRRVRTETGISRNAVSVSSIAVQLARSFFGDLSQRRVVVISAGEAGKLATNTLTGHDTGELIIINRNFERAQALAERSGGYALPFARLDQALGGADFVISATGAPNHILSHERVAAAMAGRADRPLLLVDIAVPRDVEASAGSIPGVSLYNIDDVQAFAERNLALRAQEAGKAETIVREEIGRFHQWWRTQEVVPTISALRDRADLIRAAEVAKTLKRLPDLAEADRERIEAMSRAIVAKLLHGPFMFLKGRHGDSAAVEAVRDLFMLPDDTAAPSPGDPLSVPSR